MSLLSTVLADSINDVSSTRKVYLLAAALAMLGVVLIVVTVWFWRNSRNDPELLAPLEAMGEKKFRTMDSSTQQKLLDGARPDGAEPMRWGVHRGETVQPEIDLGAINREAPKGYDDLRDPQPGTEVEVSAAALAMPASEIADEDAAALDPDTPIAEVDEAREPVEMEASAETDVADDVVPDAQPALVASEAAAVSTIVDEPIDNHEHEAAELVIVPLDHELVASRDARDDPQPSAPIVDEEPEPQASPSIDPLLRMFDRKGQ